MCHNAQNTHTLPPLISVYPTHLSSNEYLLNKWLPLTLQILHMCITGISLFNTLFFITTSYRHGRSFSIWRTRSRASHYSDESQWELADTVCWRVAPIEKHLSFLHLWVWVQHHPEGSSSIPFTTWRPARLLASLQQCYCVSEDGWSTDTG